MSFCDRGTLYAFSSNRAFAYTASSSTSPLASLPNPRYIPTMTEHCQIYLLTPPVIDDVAAFCKTLEEALAAAPVACLQIRLKDLENSALVQAGKAITQVCHAAGVEVIVNDDPSLVADIGADGAHIGQEDMDYFSSRELLGGDAIIGVTCHNSCLLYTSPSPRDQRGSRMPSSA